MQSAVLGIDLSPVCCSQQYWALILSRVLQPSEVPGRLAGTNSPWNCSVQHWPHFQRHFRCNMRQECVNKEDEIQCPYSSCDHGGVRIKRYCYFYVVSNVSLSWLQAQLECRLMGARLASLSSLHKWNGVMTWLSWRQGWRDRDALMYVGLTSVPQGMPYMWVDGCLGQPMGSLLKAAF